MERKIMGRTRFSDLLSSFRKAFASDACLSAKDMLLLAVPWYHDFDVLGIPTLQMFGHFRANQESKQGHIFDLTRKAVELCRDRGPDIKGLELFCCDGFYSNYAVASGVRYMTGLDNNRYSLMKAELITRILGNGDRIKFLERDVFDIRRSYDLCICAGGLYHISDPAALLRAIADKVGKALVVQTVYSSIREEADYFESPAPGWTWGCRFSHKKLLNMLDETGWDVLESRTNELKGNKKAENIASVYVLCSKKTS